MRTRKSQIAFLFHDLLNPVSSIRSILYFILMEKTQPIDKKTEKYLKECLKYCDELVKKLNDLQESLRIIKPNPKQ